MHASSPSMAPLRILISGGGIAGPALALCLSRLGHRCTVLERFPQLRASGQQIDLREQGVDAARRIAVLDDVKRHAVDESGVQFIDERGRRRAIFPRTASDTSNQGFSSEFEIMRGDLCRVLVDAAPSNNKPQYRFGLSVTGFDENNQRDHVKVRLSDESTEQYDLLVGADGQGSRIRKMLLASQPAATGSDTPTPAQESSRHLGVYCAYYSLPREPGDPNLGTIYHTTGRRAMATRWHASDRGQAFLAFMGHDEETRRVLGQDATAQRNLFERLFADAGWQAPRLLRGMHRAEDFYAQSIVQIKCRPWSRGRVVLLGDAGYCPSPLSGMGTSLALTGAYVLAGELSKNFPSSTSTSTSTSSNSSSVKGQEKGNSQLKDIVAACTAYEDTLRPLVDHVQKLPPGVPGIAYPKTALGVATLRGVVGLAPALKLNKLFETSLIPRRNKWEIPDYPQLDRAGRATP